MLIKMQLQFDDLKTLFCHLGTEILRKGKKKNCAYKQLCRGILKVLQIFPSGILVMLTHHLCYCAWQHISSITYPYNLPSSCSCTTWWLFPEVGTNLSQGENVTGQNTHCSLVFSWWPQDLFLLFYGWKEWWNLSLCALNSGLSTQTFQSIASSEYRRYLSNRWADAEPISSCITYFYIQAEMSDIT